MSWKEFVHPLHSRAEYQVYFDLKKAGLHSLLMDKTVKLEKKLDDKNVVFASYPDFWYRGQDHIEWLIYLDGPPHLKRNVEAHDKEVTEAANLLGKHVLRYEYKTPLKPERQREIVNDILSKIRPDSY